MVQPIADELARQGWSHIRSKVEAAICDFSLSMNASNVLTEAANGYFAVTPLIAALAGATVDAVARDSNYGSADDVVKMHEKIAESWGVRHKIVYHKKLSENIIRHADIITNLGHVRPIDKSFVDKMKDTAVIPLMWETWEWRRADVDIEACRNKGIPVLGTNERVPGLRIFDYVGALALKLLFEAGLEIINQRIALVGSGEFLNKSEDKLQAVGADTEVVRITGDRMQQCQLSGDIDAVVFLEHQHPRELVGANGIISNERTFWHKKRIVHICGNIDAEWLSRQGAILSPLSPASFGTMSYNTAYVGPVPVIRLHTAGLKVGEAMWRARLSGLEGSEFIESVMRMAPAMTFEDRI